MDISDLREEYTRGTLTRGNLNKNPFQQFETWFHEAEQSQILEPNAMSLATVSDSGIPSIRTVLLKYFDEKGFVFFTNYASTKAREMTQNPHVALSFLWAALERQVHIKGSVKQISKTESFKYFSSRPRGSQLGAWVSHQSSIITGRSLLETKLHEMKEKFKAGKIPLPSFWGGYRVVPDSIEFWQGQPNRLHDRLLFSRNSQQNNSWDIERLSP
ncbi:Pyridoxine/pyridoxamine 5'-phosphate oxidase [invertebrate metagenome]|uniref:pyridoxal 5'-phosphate synthase n=1 Tax=invertebrate metagenome TaxID=1711999 RepID=A0A2H9T463_9ZZZZ